MFDAVLEAVNGIWVKADEKNISIEFEHCGEDKMQAVMCDKNGFRKPLSIFLITQ